MFIVLMSGSAILTALIIGITILHRSSKAIALEAQQSMLHFATKTAFEIDNQLIKIETAVTTFRYVVEETFDTHKALDNNYIHEYDKFIEPIIKTIAEKNKEGMNAYLWFDPSLLGKGYRITYADTRQDGTYSRIPSFLDNEYFNPDDPGMAWYYEPIKNKKGMWSEPYFWKQYNSYLITYAEPIFINDKLIGVFGIDAYFNQYRDTINNLKIYHTGSAAILSQNLSFITHKHYGVDDTLSIIKGGIYQPLHDEIKAKSSDVMSIDKTIFAFARLKNGNTILIEAPKTEVLDQITKLQKDAVLLLLFIFPIIIGLAWWASKRITNPIIAASKHAQAIAEGDFRAELPDYIKIRKDEIGILGHSLQIMTNNLKELVNKMTEANLELETSLYQLNASEEQLRQQYGETKKAENELRQYKSNLEDLVRKRTQELSTANDELHASNQELVNKNNIINQTNHELHQAFKALKEAQIQLIQAEKMASLGILTAGVAHEINNPLNYLMGANVGLRDYFIENGSQDEEQTTILLDSMEIGIERISGIVKGLNQFSRNNNSLDEDCDIHTIIDNCLTILHNQIKYKIEIHKKYANQRLTIKGNTGRLHQAFLNIINNAIQAIPEKGNIQIRTSLLHSQTLIEIEDDGVGIKQEDLPLVTDPFFTTKPPGKGTGLGLSITQTIVEEHKGQMRFESEINKGTKLVLVFPLFVPPDPKTT